MLNQMASPLYGLKGLGAPWLASEYWLSQSVRDRGERVWASGASNATMRAPRRQQARLRTSPPSPGSSLSSAIPNVLLAELPCARRCGDARRAASRVPCAPLYRKWTGSKVPQNFCKILLLKLRHVSAQAMYVPARSHLKT